MSKNINIEEIEDSIWEYLQYLEELKLRLMMYQLELLIRRPHVELIEPLGIEEIIDDENWYSD